MPVDGFDPIAGRDAKRPSAALEKAKAVTFEWCAIRYMADHEAGWRNAKHRQQWHNTLKTYAYPIIGKMPVGSIDADLVTQILRPIWRRRTGRLPDNVVESK